MLKFMKRRRLRRLGVMTGREAAARALYSAHVQGSALDLLNYDRTPHLQRLWQAEADLHIAHAASPDRFIAAHFGYTPEEWMSLSSLFKADKREEFFQVQGMAS
jgi:hypothetical protein